MTEQPAPENPSAQRLLETGGYGYNQSARATLQAVDSKPEAREQELQRLAAAVAHHEDQAKRHTDAAKAAKHAVMLLHGKRGSTVEVGDTAITWKNPSRSFDAAGLQAKYPYEANPWMYTIPEPQPVLDLSAVPPKLKDEFMRDGTGDGTIIIK